MPHGESMRRKSNFELLRILAASLIVAYHFLCGAGYHPYYGGKSYASEVKLISIILGSWGILGVDLFVIISAFFLRNAIWRVERLISLIIQVFFYELLFTTAEFIYQCAIGGLAGGLKAIVLLYVDKALQPLWAKDYWYVTTYIFLYLLVPWLNKIIQSFEEKQYKKLLIILTFIPLYSNFWVGTPPVANIANFVYIYLLIGYLEKWNRQTFFEKHAFKGTIVITILIVVALWLNMVFPSKGIKGMVKNFLPFTFANMNRHSLIILLDALMIFYLFKGIEIPTSKVINSISACTLGVYLFHENPTFIPMSKTVDTLLRNLVKWEPGASAFLLHCLLGCFLLFLGGLMIEVLRKPITEKAIVPCIRKRFSKEIEQINNWFRTV